MCHALHTGARKLLEAQHPHLAEHIVNHPHLRSVTDEALHASPLLPFERHIPTSHGHAMHDASASASGQSTTSTSSHMYGLLSYDASTSKTTDPDAWRADMTADHRDPRLLNINLMPFVQSVVCEARNLFLLINTTTIATFVPAGGEPSAFVDAILAPERWPLNASLYAGTRWKCLDSNGGVAAASRVVKGMVALARNRRELARYATSPRLSVQVFWGFV